MIIIITVAIFILLFQHNWHFRGQRVKMYTKEQTEADVLALLLFMHAYYIPHLYAVALSGQ